MRPPARVMPVIALVALVSIACSEHLDTRAVQRLRPPETSVAPLPSVPESSTAPPIEEGSCPNQAEVTSNPLNRVAGPLIGDATGDATPERIYLSLDEAGTPGCQAFVVVAGASTITAPIEGWDPTAGISSPTLNGLVQIDGRPGVEIVVNLAAGASTQFVGAFAVSSTAIERLTTSGDATTTGSADLFAYGGSVGHLEAVDCAPDGQVVLSSAIPKGDRYQVDRRFFVPSGATLQLQADASRRAVVSLNRLEDFPEFGASPFGTCPTA
jgi:hypothetical protein